MSNHKHSWLAHYHVFGYQAIPEMNAEGEYTFHLRGPYGTMQPPVTASNLSRMGILIYMSVVARFVYTGDVQNVMKIAAERVAQITTHHGREYYAGCSFELLFHPNGIWTLEFEPRVGTNVATMSFTTMGDALQALNGILDMLSVQEGDDVPYLCRNSGYFR